MTAQWLPRAARRRSRPPRPASRRSRLGGSLAAAGLAAALAGCSASAGTAPAGAISVTTGACGGRWHLDAAGWHTFTITNASSQAAEVNLINPANNAIYAEVEAMGPGTSQPMRLRVGSGTYAFQCVLEDTDPIRGPSVRVPGHVPGAPGVVPVTSNDMIEPSKEYHAYVTAGLVTLVSQTKALNAAIQAGQLARAKQAWLPAHLTYEGLGAAYGTFGDFDGEIDTRPDGLAGGVNDPHFTGFYRIEYGLWHGQSAAQLKGPAAALLHSVLALRAAFPAMEIDFLDIGLRTHEILENALQFQLSGHDDYGSGTTLATTAANITGTEELLTILHPILVPRYPGLPGVYLWLGRLLSLLNAQHHGPAWTPASRLPTATREQIDAAASQSLQELAPIAVITEPRRI
jgi:iron uptake system component EfeO